MAETETEWSREWPKETGFYWTRETPNDTTPILVEVRRNRLTICGEAVKCDVKEAFEVSEFLGPISPSDSEQLTRLREAAEKALRLIGKGRGHIGWCRHRHQQINDRDSNASLDEWLKDRTQVEDALREALAQRNTGGK